MPLSYQNYLMLDKLLDLQQPRSEEPEHDETLFIVVHQVYELWFKQILHELNQLQPALEYNNMADIIHGFKRILAILKTLVAQIDVLETMTPVAFSSFRERLESASGFQSMQFRTLEFRLGLRNLQHLQRFPPDSAEYLHLSRVVQQPCLWDSFLCFLSRNKHPVPEAQLQRDVTAPLSPSPELQAILIDIYKRHTAEAEICERLVDLDEGIQEWRYRHIKMVERTIGRKRGSGGSAGADYLKNTIFKPLYPDLWEIRVSF